MRSQPVLVQVVLEDYRGGDGIQLATLAQPTHVAALRPGNLFGLASRKPFVPHLDGHAKDALGNPSKVLGATGLATLGTVRV